MNMRTLVFPILILTLFGCKKPPTAPPEKEPGVKRDFIWTVDTLKTIINGELVQPNFVLNNIWGASPTDVWAASDESLLWHYDGNNWTSVKKSDYYHWPFLGSDAHGYYTNNPVSVTGFNANHVLVACNRAYISKDTSVAAILRWNGTGWEDVPFVNERPRFIIGIIKDNNDRAWGVTMLGRVIRYENGLAYTEPMFYNYEQDMNYGLRIYSIAATDNGYVYVNAYKDSIKNDQIQGEIYNLFKRDLSGQWNLIEHKVVIGSYYDNNGLGLGLFGIGNRVFTENKGIWEMIAGGWTKISPPSYSDFGGGYCFITESNLWFYLRSDLYNYNNNDWKKIDVPVLANFPGGNLYGQGWSDGKEIFIPLVTATTSYVLHGK